MDLPANRRTDRPSYKEMRGRDVDKTKTFSISRQVSTSNSLELQEDPYEEVIAEISSKLGLTRIGWIFTDLVAEDLEKGSVKHFRGNVETHFLSGQVNDSTS